EQPRYPTLHFPHSLGGMEIEDSRPGSRGALDFRAVNDAVDLAAHEEHGTRQVEPDHQDDYAADGAVGFVVAPEVFDVEPESLADDDPAADGERTSWRQPVPGKLQAGDHAIDNRSVQPQAAANHAPADAASQDRLQHGNREAVHCDPPGENGAR